MNAIIQELLEVPEETQTLEFKRLEGKNVVSKISETLVAMANTDGGRIVIGIDDPEKTECSGLDRVYGIEENPELLDEVKRTMQKVIPPIAGVDSPKLIEIQECGKTVAIVTVPKATEHFHTFNNHVYIRLNKGNKRLTPQEVVKFSYVKGFEKADRELVSVDFELLNTDWYKAWKLTRGLPGGDIKDVLFQTGLARKDSNGNLLPTRAAVLLFANYPTNLMDTKCTLRILQYTGRIENYREVPNMVSSPVTIEGPLVKLISDAQNYVLTLLRSGIEIHSGFITKYQIPERAIKEAITNAVIHRDYHTKRDIEVKIFEDRVEVNSPGLFPFNITKTNIGKVRSDGYRNDLLVKHLREFPEPPNLDQNEGVRAMQNVMHASNLLPPIYWTYPYYQDAVEVGLFNEHRSSEWDKVKEYLLKNKYINNEKAREITGVVQAYKMSTLFKKWVGQGLLTKIQTKNESRRFTRYKLSNQEDINTSI